MYIAFDDDVYGDGHVERERDVVCTYVVALVRDLVRRVLLGRPVSMYGLGIAWVLTKLCYPCSCQRVGGTR